MTNQEAKMIAYQIVKHLDILFGQPRCQWISEATALTEFPFSKDQLRRLRDNSNLEFRYHWKNAGERKRAMGAGRSPMRIYHRERMIKFIEEL